jgi:hypothetical protein
MVTGACPPLTPKAPVRVCCVSRLQNPSLWPQVGVFFAVGESDCLYPSLDLPGSANFKGGRFRRAKTTPPCLTRADPEPIEFLKTLKRTPDTPAIAPESRIATSAQ